jgi:hypothetical protein
MSGQPDYGVAIWKFDLAQVIAHESLGAAPAIIIDSVLLPTFTLESQLTNVGPGGAALIFAPGTPGTISYYASRLDAALPVVPLTPTTFTMTAATVNVNSAAFNTAGPAGPNSLAPGVWNVVVLVNFPGTAFANTVGGFNSIVIDIR